MEVVDTTQINSFAPFAAQTNFSVSPSEEAVFITVCQLQDLIARAIQPLQDEVRDLKATVARQDEKIAALESTQETQADNQLIQLRLIGQLREAAQKITVPTPPQGAKTLARIAKIEEVLKSRGPSTLKELERILEIDRATMTRLLGKLDMRRYELHSRPRDDREKVLRLKVQIR